MPLDRSQLSDLLKAIDAELDRRVTIVAVEGTAMTLLNLKPSTMDIDFTGPARDIEVFDRAQRTIPHGFKLDLWPGGQVFSQILPGNYLAKSIDIQRMLHIQLKALHPVDIVVTKIGRLDKRDEEDIEACIKEYRLTRAEISRRGNKVEYVGHEEIYESNLKYVLRRFFVG